MSALGDGLLGFATGALGAAEKQYQGNLEQARKMSLEEYRLQKQKQLEDYRAGIDKNVAELTHKRKLDAVKDDQKFRSEEADKRDAAQQTRTETTASGRQEEASATERKAMRDQAKLDLNDNTFGTLDSLNESLGIGANISKAKNPEEAFTMVLRSKSLAPEQEEEILGLRENYRNNNRGISSVYANDPDATEIEAYADYLEISLDIEQRAPIGEEAAPVEAMPEPKTQAEYDKLPSGTRYIAPDGQELTKK